MAILEVVYKGEVLKVTIDEEDVERVSSYKWSGWRASRDGLNNTYIRGSVYGKACLLHRFIAGARQGLLVDHINGDTLDNRKCNLRVATATQNMWNRRKSPNAKGSQYKGVCATSKHSRKASVKVNGTVWNSTGHDSEKSAAIAYNELANLAFGDYALLNKIDFIT